MAPSPALLDALPAPLLALSLPVSGGEFWDAMELRVTALELQDRGVQLTPIESDRGRGLQAALELDGVRCTLTSYFAEGPHYFMLALDIASAVTHGELPDVAAQAFFDALALPSSAKCWQSRLDSLFHQRADEKFARDVLGIDSSERTKG